MRSSTSIILIFAIICFACVLNVSSAPVSDTEAYRLLDSYLQRLYEDEGQGMILVPVHGSMKRGLGPRPLRFG
ncbi:unnamed protein product [Auanema sp. JU1783]|nr:unnamed protein product [Auanema sp. JU1783]